MAEAFSNKVARAAGIVTSYSGSTVAAGSTAITVTALTGIGVSFLVDNQNFIAGTKVVQTLPVSGGVGNCIYRQKFYKYGKCKQSGC